MANSEQFINKVFTTLFDISDEDLFLMDIEDEYEVDSLVKTNTHGDLFVNAVRLA